MNVLSFRFFNGLMAIPKTRLIFTGGPPCDCCALGWIYTIIEKKSCCSI